MPSERLQKIIAAAGVASRRNAEKLITSGAVSINGQIVTELGTKADIERDHIRVNGKLLHGAERHIYLLMNKPKGYVTTLRDPEGRPTIMDLVRGIRVRVYPVGRLDYASEGLLLLTNDGDLAHRLMKAASHVAKTYVVKVAGIPAAEGLERLRRGLMISAESKFHPKGLRRDNRKPERVKTAPAKIRLVRESDNPWYEVTPRQDCARGSNRTEPHENVNNESKDERLRPVRASAHSQAGRKQSIPTAQAVRE